MLLASETLSWSSSVEFALPAWLWLKSFTTNVFSRSSPHHQQFSTHGTCLKMRSRPPRIRRLWSSSFASCSTASLPSSLSFVLSSALIFLLDYVLLRNTALEFPKPYEVGTVVCQEEQQRESSQHLQLTASLMCKRLCRWTRSTRSARESHQ